MDVEDKLDVWKNGMSLDFFLISKHSDEHLLSLFMCMDVCAYICTHTQDEGHRIFIIMFLKFGI